MPQSRSHAMTLIADIDVLIENDRVSSKRRSPAKGHDSLFVLGWENGHHVGEPDEMVLPETLA
jgi:hypothetical protein